MSAPYFAGIDAGGTEFKCIVASGPDSIVAMEKIPVTTPAETLPLCADFFSKVRREHSIRSLGIASFGPLDLHRDSFSFGYITTTTKAGWQQTDIVGYFQNALQLPVSFDTDVNGALLGENRWGAARGLHSAVYVTVGTGIGVGVMMDKVMLHGQMHTESGHMLMPRARHDNFRGVCTFHGDCLEGLASGPAIEARWGCSPKNLPSDHPAWALQAKYLGDMCYNLALFYSPQKIVLGGGVMQKVQLLNAVRQHYAVKLNAYLGNKLGQELDAFIVPAELEDKAGALGAVAMAQKLMANASDSQEVKALV